ncbi:glycosyltransferase family 2 protein [Tsuneonella mangrovi]|uniref:glycosyltransferase family 2 protein n=1 Tax=Tsuneonella mangrovi TaxID=1982042 RepID=UPI000BA267DD|nr:glycosyltransferase [Tsuneonella mangrovi]
MSAPFSVVIPAHNEEAVIARCLQALLHDAPRHALPEVVVVANACNDRTADIARQSAPHAKIVEIPVGSKTLAMNEGRKHVGAAPCFFLDADVQCSHASLAATAEVLEQPGVMIASPALRMDLSRSDRWVRAYYRVWLTQPYASDHLVGSGLFGISAAGLESIGDFPPIFGDDVWLRTRFTRHERRSVPRGSDGQAAYFVVSPPRTWADQVRIEARRRIGIGEVANQFDTSDDLHLNHVGDLPRALAGGTSLLDVTIYVAMKAAAIGLYRWYRLLGRKPVWTRDTRARQPE